MRLRARSKIDLVLDYLSMGIDIKSLDLKMSLDTFVSLIYPKEFKLMSNSLSPYDFLCYMKSYDQFKVNMLAQFLKEGLYSICLLLISYVLSWFFLSKFSVSVIEMISSFEVDVSMIHQYQVFVQGYLFVVHVTLVMVFIFFWLYQSLDLRIMFYILICERIPFIRDYVTYRFALLMSLFLKYGIKTQSMIDVMRLCGLDPFSRWVASTISHELSSGSNLIDAIDQTYLDPRFILLAEQGLRRHTYEENITSYVEIVRRSLQQSMTRILGVFKIGVFLYLLILMAMFYAVLYLPMQIMEVL